MLTLASNESNILALTVNLIIIISFKLINNNSLLKNNNISSLHRDSISRVK